VSQFELASGHGFSHAVNGPQEGRLQPLRDVCSTLRGAPLGPTAVRKCARCACFRHDWSRAL